MSGHSKWANIRVKKTAQDARRGKVFTRHARLIEIAARSGGGDPEMNATLRTAIDNAKIDSVPNANIERAIKKGTGELKGEGQMEELTYEAYGPGGAAFIIECLTDNRARTIANVRSIITRQGGRMAEANAVMWMFERRGLVVGRRASGVGGGRDAPPMSHELRHQTSDTFRTSTTGRPENIEQLELELIDFGAEDFSVDGEVISVTTGMAE